MASHAANAKLLQRMNELSVLEEIRSGHPISRAQVSRRVGLSKPTVSSALQVLINAGLVREASEPIHPNFGATFYEPAFEAAYALAVDVGARFLRGALCDLGGEVRARVDLDVSGRRADEILRRARGLRDQLLEMAHVSVDDIDGAVLGIPGVVEDGERIVLGNIPGLDGITVGEIRECLGVEVAVENDINLAAIGERWRGVGQGVDDFVYLSIGSGIGAGLFLDGKLRRGRHGAAGEIEYVGADTLADDPCARGIAAHAAALLAQGGHDTRLRSPYEPPAVFAAARQGDELARAVVQEEVHRIARYIEGIAAIVDVELVVLGGGIGANDDLLLGPLRSSIGARLPYPPALEVSRLGEAAVIMGALALGLQAALERVVDRRRPPAAQAV
jgi:predicted NBD/HSP70 family sugar kinase